MCTASCLPPKCPGRNTSLLDIQPVHRAGAEQSEPLLSRAGPGSAGLPSARSHRCHTQPASTALLCHCPPSPPRPSPPTAGSALGGWAAQGECPPFQDRVPLTPGSITTPALTRVTDRVCGGDGNNRDTGEGPPSSNPGTPTLVLRVIPTLEKTKWVINVCFLQRSL